MLIDSHCHIQFKVFEKDREEVISRSFEKDIIMNAVGTQKKTSQLAVQLAEKYDNIFATVGLHPIQEYVVKVEEEDSSFTSRGEDFDFEYYSRLAENPKVIAIGETGLDKYHIPKDKTEEEIFRKQKNIFLQHVKLAQKHSLPLVIHVRDAHEEMLQVLQSLVTSHQSPVTAVIHCFTGNWQQAEAYLKMGFYLGFTGVVTFPPKKTAPKPQEELLEVVKKVPTNKILVETDAPYLAPQAHRGKRSEPWMTEEVVKFIANYKQLDLNKFRLQTVSNTKKLFSRLKGNIS
jgi:TatD DNase family protein